MPLILSLKEGADFFVGETQFVVSKVVHENEFVLTPTEGKVLTITDKHSTEIMPDVFVSAGYGHPANTAAVAIEAPSNVLILRGELKRKGKAA